MYLKVYQNVKFKILQHIVRCCFNSKVICTVSVTRILKCFYGLFFFFLAGMFSHYINWNIFLLAIKCLKKTVSVVVFLLSSYICWAQPEVISVNLRSAATTLGALV